MRIQCASVVLGLLVATSQLPHSAHAQLNAETTALSAENDHGTSPDDNLNLSVSESLTVSITLDKGFDIACIPADRKGILDTESFDKMWANGFRSVGVYLGGCDVTCVAPKGPDPCGSDHSLPAVAPQKRLNAGLTPANIQMLLHNGWSIIPIWVGRQSPSTLCNNKLLVDHLDSNNAEKEGESEAKLAIQRFNDLSLIANDPNHLGVIYYDMECYDREPGAASAVRSFLEGWTSTLRSAHFSSGIYVHNLNLSDFYDYKGKPLMNPAPDAVWIAFPGWIRNPSQWPPDRLIPENRIMQYCGNNDSFPCRGPLAGIDNDAVNADVMKMTDAYAQEWTWIGGADSTDARGVYGAKGVPSPTNVPGARSGAVSWRDSAGNLWLFGGYGVDSSGNTGYLNDLWQFEPGTKAWTWRSGSSARGQPGSYGQQGVASLSNAPGARSRAVTWTDARGQFWLFGGMMEDSSGQWHAMNDLWRFSPATGAWEWMSGSNNTDQVGSYGSKGISSVANIPGARADAMSWIDERGNLWLFGGDYAAGFSDSTESQTFSYSNGLQRYYSSAGYLQSGSGNDHLYVYCANAIPGSSGYPVIYWENGESAVMVSGPYTVGNDHILDMNFSAYPNWRNSAIEGIGFDDSNYVYLYDYCGASAVLGDSVTSVQPPTAVVLNDLWEYNPTSGLWTWVSGSNSNNQSGSYGVQRRRSAANIIGARAGAVTWADGSGNLWLFGGYGVDSDGNVGKLNDLWNFDPVSRTWGWINGSKSDGQPGIYGAKGVQSFSNNPGARANASGVLDANGDLWLFGGSGLDSAGQCCELNDLWQYNPARNVWTWMGGSKTVGQAGTYGTLGVPSGDNFPGSRHSATGWIDGNGEFLLLGGASSSSPDDLLNDLWEYGPGGNLTINNTALDGVPRSQR